MRSEIVRQVREEAPTVSYDLSGINGTNCFLVAAALVEAATGCSLGELPRDVGANQLARDIHDLLRKQNASAEFLLGKEQVGAPNASMAAPAGAPANGTAATRRAFDAAASEPADLQPA